LDLLHVLRAGLIRSRSKDVRQIDQGALVDAHML
jgi:hypothetical protein